MSWRAAGAAVVIAFVCFLIVRGNNYQTFIIATVGLTAIVGIGLNVLVGLNGQISLGHVAFYAIGAYTVGILTTAHDWSFWPALLAAGITAGSKTPNKEKVGKVTRKQVLDIVKMKSKDLNATNEEAAFRVIAGTARSMGIEVVG